MTTSRRCLTPHGQHNPVPYRLLWNGDPMTHLLANCDNTIFSPKTPIIPKEYSLWFPYAFHTMHVRSSRFLPYSDDRCSCWTMYLKLFESSKCIVSGRPSTKHYVSSRSFDDAAHNTLSHEWMNRWINFFHLSSVVGRHVVFYFELWVNARHKKSESKCTASTRGCTVFALLNTWRATRARTRTEHVETTNFNLNRTYWPINKSALTSPILIRATVFMQYVWWSLGYHNHRHGF